jgi:phage terminase small subunit
MVRFAAEFGMTPSARSRINATPPGEGAEDPAARFFTG